MKNNTWTKIKKTFKDNPDDAFFYGTLAVMTVGLAAFTVYVVKETNKEVAEYNEAVENQRKWTVDQLAQGRLITYLPDGTPWSFDPTKPLYEAV